MKARRRPSDPHLATKRSRFETRREVDRYFGGKTIRCLLCGQRFRRLAFHLAAKHGITADDYKARFVETVDEIVETVAHDRGALGITWPQVVKLHRLPELSTKSPVVRWYSFITLGNPMTQCERSLPRPDEPRSMTNLSE